MRHQFAGEIEIDSRPDIPYYCRKGVRVLGLLNRRADFSQDAMSCILRSDEVLTLLRRCISACTSSGEWVAISHDGTYKLAKSLIGEKEVGGMYRNGWPKVIHTIRGISGAAPGICIQCGERESRDSCMCPITDIPHRNPARNACSYTLATLGTPPPCPWIRVAESPHMGYYRRCLL